MVKSPLKKNKKWKLARKTMTCFPGQVENKYFQKQCNSIDNLSVTENYF